MNLGEIQVWQDTTQRALDVQSDIGTFRNISAHPIRIHRWGFVCTVAWNCTAALIAKLDHTTYDKAGTSTRSDGSGGFNLTAVVNQVVGSVVYVTPGGDKNSASIDATGEFIMKPGDLVTFQVTQAMTAGDGHPFIEFQNMNFDDVSLRSEFSDEDGTAASKLRVVEGGVAI